MYRTGVSAAGRTVIGIAGCLLSYRAQREHDKWR